MNLSEWVELYTKDFGFNCIPLKHQSKEPDVFSWKQFQGRQYTGSFKEGQNVAIVCGKISGIVVIDIDDKTLINEILIDENGKPTFQDWKTRTLMTETARGIHIYVKPRDGKFPPTSKLIDGRGRGIDIKGEGGYVVAPPSIHPDGSKYQVISAVRTIAEIDVGAFIKFLQGKAGFSGGLRKAKLETVLGGGVGEGNRNDSAYVMARYLLNPMEGGLSDLDARDRLRKWNETNVPPLESREIDRIFESAGNIPFEERPMEFDLKSFKRNYVARHITVTLHPKTLRENDEIYVYKNGLYVDGGETHIKEVLHRLYYGISRNEVNELLATIRATTFVTNSDFDTHPEIIHLRNCLFNIQTMKVFEQTHTLLTRNQLNVNYNPDAQCPLIMKFLSEVMPDPDDLKTLIQLVSSVLLYKIKLEKAIIFVGDQANGKSTLIELLVDMLGEENVSNVSLQRLAGNAFATSTMMGKILNAYGDLDDNEIGQTGMIKQIISHDHIMVEKKNKNAFSTRIPIRLLYSANRLPELPRADDAIFRRFWIIKWPIVIPVEKRDLKLLEKLTTPEEKSGFLNVLLKNAHELLNNNFQFTHPQHLEMTKRLWREKSDSVSAWCEAEIVINPDYKIKTTELYEIYREWCRKNDELAATNRTFFMKLEGLGPYRKSKTSKFGRTFDIMTGAKPKKIIALEKEREGQAQL